MYKLIQFRAAQAAPLKTLLSQHMARAFPKHEKFVEEALANVLVTYVRDKKVPLSFNPVKEKSIVSAVVPTLSPNIANGAPEPGNIVYEEEGLVVVNKPSELATQPTLRAADDNLYHQLILQKILAKKQPARLPYIGLHHRLDRDTSGLVIFTSRASQNKLVADWFQHRRIRKTYLAVVKGTPEEQEWKVTKNIKRKIHEHHKFYFIATDFGGNKAESRFKVLAHIADDYHLVQAEPVTGRTHQLRVHLKASGLKVLGDRLYGAEAKNKPMRLHAWKMQLPWRKNQKTFACLPDWPELKDLKF